MDVYHNEQERATTTHATSSGNEKLFHVTIGGGIAKVNALTSRSECLREGPSL